MDQPRIKVEVEARYIEEQSAPESNRYAFAYTVTITNHGPGAANLRSRHWIITESDGSTREVEGDGVVGEQPTLRPGEAFRYTSGAILQSAVGSMRGSYRMEDELGRSFEAEIPAFTLALPGSLH